MIKIEIRKVSRNFYTFFCRHHDDVLFGHGTKRKVKRDLKLFYAELKAEGKVA